jgi:DNA-binding NarL/FixJ family response regulator
VRIAIAEDYSMMRDLLRTVCSREFGYEVVAEASDGPAAVESVRRTQPDLLLLDIHLPGFDGFEVIEQVRAREPAPRILVLSSYCDEYTVARIISSAVQGFIDKGTSTVAVLREAITTVARNGTYFSETVRQRIDLAATGAVRPLEEGLSPRERTILLMIGRLLTDQEIAVHLNISSATVEKHRFNIYRKLGLKSRPELMRYARDHGYFDIPN